MLEHLDSWERRTGLSQAELWRVPELASLSVQVLADLFEDCLSACGNPTLFEVGAHLAEQARGYRALGGRAIALEANPYVVERALSMEGIASSWYLFCAAAERCGTTDLHLADGGLDAAQQTTASLLHPVQGSTRTVQVPKHTLDCLCGILSCASPMDVEVDRRASIALWIDVEGAVQQVLMGAHCLLQRTSLALVECETREEWRHQWIEADIIHELAKSDLVPIAADSQAFDQRNILFARLDLIQCLGQTVDSAAARARQLVRRRDSLSGRLMASLLPLRDRLQLRSRMARRFSRDR